MTKYEIMDEYGIRMLITPAEGNRKLTDAEEKEYREFLSMMVGTFKAAFHVETEVSE